MYNGAKTRVQTLIGNTEFFSVEVGLHQGSAISPYLFALILDELSRGIQKDILWCMIFANDIVLVSESAEGLNDRLENWREALEANGLRILQPKESFRYLRSMLHKSGRIDEDVAHSIKAAWLKPAMLYGSECWPITKALANRMEVAELRMLRWTCGKTMLDMIPNGVYRAELEVETIINKMREGRLRWFGHVRRRPQSAPVRRVEALVVDGMRRRGRPKLRWEDRVKLDMKELLLSEDMTSDRNEWRARTSFACEWFACLVSFLLFLFGFCVLDSDRLDRWASFRLGGSMEGFEGLVRFGLPLFASSSLALWCSLLPFPFACFRACVLPCFACPFSVALCCRRSSQKQSPYPLRVEGSYHCGSVRLMGAHNQNSLQSKADQTVRISRSVFVSNFPEGCTAKHLWKVCNDYGTVVDVFIPTKKSKVGKRFAFVRFIKAKGQFQTGSYVNVVNGSSPAAVNGVWNTPVSASPAMVLDDSCVVLRDIGNYVMGEVGCGL
ncbi:retrovirus-related pol polyprotein LINE-1 [Tanacetum coccineum]